MTTSSDRSTSDPLAWTDGLALAPCREVKMIKGLTMPAAVRYRQILVVGPPGAGKTHLIRTLGGWPEEGYIDITQKNWWRAHPLTLRPREVNLGFPFVGHPQALSVFDDEWLGASRPLVLDAARIIFPPARSHFLATDWRARYAYFFLMPRAAQILAGRLSRVREGVHPVDAHVTLEEVERQLAIYRSACVLFHRAALATYVVDDFDGRPKFLSSRPPAGAGTAERAST